MRFSDLRTRCSWVETITNVINNELKLKELKSRNKEVSRVSQVINYISSKINRVTITSMVNRLSLTLASQIRVSKVEEEGDGEYDDDTTHSEY